MEIVTPAVSPDTVIAQRHGAGTRPLRAWGFVDTSKVNSDVFLRALEEQMRGELERSIEVRKPAPGVSLSGEELTQLAEESDGVVLGFGDCGTSMSFAVRDAVALEQLGVPAVVVCSTAFAPGARELSGLMGLKSLPVIELPHPLASRSSADIRALAAETLPRIMQAIRTSSEPNDGEFNAIPDRLSVSSNVSEVVEQLHAREWTDGLPVIPPSVSAVAALVEATGNDPKSPMPPVPPAHTRTDLERWAANAVMAGCLPQHFPAVLAGMEAVLADECGLESSQVATNTSAPLLWLNGPIRDAIHAERGYNVLGPGSRSTASIGRGIRLILRNVGRELPGLTDLATHGQPGKITYCFAENEEESPWEPWHVTQGFDAEESTITAVIASPPQNIFAYGCNNALDLIAHFIGAMTALGHNNILFDTGPVLVLGPEHANLLDREGVSRKDLQAAIYERARIRLDRFPDVAQRRMRTRRSRWFELNPDAQEIGVADRPDDVYVVVAGGPGIHSQFISTSFSARPITRRISPWPVGERQRSPATAPRE